ncbi:MAG: family 43 glycosylhydrolase [Anaerolineaceae bacterium]|nr:family 43 glycosylhydrolase [Anaerolineaceae bacterium]
MSTLALLNYKPVDGWAADFIPFYWEGEYHLFYLKDFRDPPGMGEGTPWFHLVTRDFVHFTELGECLPRGSVEEQDLYVFTGSALYAEGRFHIFYTGHNPHLRRAGRPEQALMHAVSDDLLEWHKLPEDTFFAPPDQYEANDWRDPFVFWNEEAGEYWMLLAARLKNGPERRRGCTALCSSPDLKQWTVREPLYAPGLYYTHECPDLFRSGGWWYLVFSEFSEACLTRYRMARSLAGPWIAPADDAFDGRAFYAAKTAADAAVQRCLFGWNPTRAGESDSGAWQWGGSLVVHEIFQRADGSLGARLPQTIRDFLGPPLALDGKETLRLDGTGRLAQVDLGELPNCGRIHLRLRFTEGTRACGIFLRGSADGNEGCFLRLEPQRGRVVFDLWPRPGDQPFLAGLERPLRLDPGEAVEIELYVNGTLCEAYFDGAVALSARMYEHKGERWGVFASEGVLEVRNIEKGQPA